MSLQKIIDTLNKKGKVRLSKGAALAVADQLQDWADAKNYHLSIDATHLSTLGEVIVEVDMRPAVYGHAWRYCGEA